MKEKKKKEPGAEMQEVLTEEQLKKRKLHRARVSLGCMVLILAVGVVGNWYWENSDISTKISTVSAQRTKTLGEATFVDATTEAATENSYFTQAKLDRQSSRDAALEKLQKIVDTADKSAAAHKEAAQKIAKISDGINAENKIETLVTAKGVGQCLAIVSYWLYAFRHAMILNRLIFQYRSLVQIVSLTVDDNDCRKIFYLKPADRLCAEILIADHL